MYNEKFIIELRKNIVASVIEMFDNGIEKDEEKSGCSIKRESNDEDNEHLHKRAKI